MIIAVRPFFACWINFAMLRQGHITLVLRRNITWFQTRLQKNSFEFLITI